MISATATTSPPTPSSSGLPRRGQAAAGSGRRPLGAARGPPGPLCICCGGGHSPLLPFSLGWPEPPRSGAPPAVAGGCGQPGAHLGPCAWPERGAKPSLSLTLCWRGAQPPPCSVEGAAPPPPLPAAGAARRRRMAGGQAGRPQVGALCSGNQRRGKALPLFFSLLGPHFLSLTWISLARLSPARLSLARLSPARLSLARLSLARLSPARLSPARLSLARLSPARLSLPRL